SNYNKLLVICTTLLVYLAYIGASHHHHLHHCSVQYRCSDIKDTVWAMDHERCHIFHNECLLKVEQCARQNAGKSELIETDEQSCRESCQLPCSDDFDPLCAQFFQEAYITFSNECEMRNYMCEHNRPYSFYAMGECVEYPSG
ncbi:CG7695, partial [Drosophila busckii]